MTKMMKTPKSIIIQSSVCAMGMIFCPPWAMYQTMTLTTGAMITVRTWHGYGVVPVLQTLGMS